METKRFFQFEISINVMGLRPLEIFYFFQCGDRRYTSESDDSILFFRNLKLEIALAIPASNLRKIIYRRQILMHKGPRAERAK